MKINNQNSTDEWGDIQEDDNQSLIEDKDKNDVDSDSSKLNDINYLNIENISHLNMDKIAIVLDLDNTLIHSISQPILVQIGDDPEAILVIPPDGRFLNKHIYLRPHAREFVNAVLNAYKNVGIWSFGQSEYVKFIAEMLQPSRPFDFIYSADKGPPGQTTHQLKDLRHIDTHHNVISFIIDDRPLNCLYNLLRGVTIRPFYVGMDPNDACLPVAFQTLSWKIDLYFKQMHNRKK